MKFKDIKEYVQNHLKMSWLFLTGREWYWHPLEFSLLEEDTRTPEEKTEQYNKVMDSIPEEARKSFTLMYVLVIAGILLLCIVA